MKETGIKELRSYIEQAMRACGLTEENAGTVADVFIRATLRGVGHHDIYDFLPRVQWLREGKAVPNPVYRLQAAFGGVESYDAGNGLGELGCSFGMERAMQLSLIHI